MKSTLAVVRILPGQYTLILSQSSFTCGQMVNASAYIRKTVLMLEQNWGNGLGPIKMGTANFARE